ncbi:MAG: aquaporin [Phycisphaerae bacterium]|nr:aquaporin [Phycisphaerae bacterium]
MAGKLLTEFIGTFFLVLAIALAVASGSTLAPLAIGLMLMAMVYAGGHVSGAHYNPAVTVAVAIRGRCPITDVVPYWAAQFAGSFAASACAALATGKAFFAQPGAGVSPPTALLVEIVFTFALAFVVLHVATHRKTAGNSYYGAAIGLTVTAAAVTAGPVSGCALNPAVGLGTGLHAQLVAGADVPTSVFLIYSAGPIIGAALAAIAFKLVSGPDAD